MCLSHNSVTLLYFGRIPGLFALLQYSLMHIHGSSTCIIRDNYIDNHSDINSLFILMLQKWKFNFGNIWMRGSGVHKVHTSNIHFVQFISLFRHFLVCRINLILLVILKWNIYESTTKGIITHTNTHTHTRSSTQWVILSVRSYLYQNATCAYLDQTCYRENYQTEI